MSLSEEKEQDSPPTTITMEPNAPPLHVSLHSRYIAGLAAKMEASFEGAITEHLRMSGVYWSVCAMSLLHSQQQVKDEMDLDEICNWTMSCWDEATNSFGGQTGQDGHLLYTLSAIQILAIANRLDLVPTTKVVNFIQSLQQPDGSFCGDKWGEIDTRFSYCALCALSILGQLEAIDVAKAASYISKCRNLDGGFGAMIGGESHAGQVFCCIGALSIAKALDKDNHDVLSWWLAERQCDSGGLNGRSEKQADVCYSWWILSALSILGRTDWINRDKLATFILKCQDPQDGGIADRPEDMPDVFHTFFGLAGLSLLGKMPETYRQIDPVYALPVDVVERLGLQGQVMHYKSAGEELDERLQRYSVIEK